jgi:photosystem II stability/assembly factor-like uncharacterized protein
MDNYRRFYTLIQPKKYILCINNNDYIIIAWGGVAMKSSIVRVLKKYLYVVLLCIFSVGSLYSCSDGPGEEKWHRLDADNFFESKYSALLNISYGDGAFVAVGTDGMIVYSHDYGKTWKKGISENIDTDWGTTTIRGVTYGGQRFVVVDDNGGVYYSSDNGQTWNESKLPDIAPVPLLSVIYGNGSFVAGGWDGTIIYSEDQGNNWSLGDSAFESERTAIIDIAYGNGCFIAIADFNTVLKSTNKGKTWGVMNTPLAFDRSQNIKYIIFTGYDFLITTREGTIYSSSNDGQTWKELAKLEINYPRISYSDNCLAVIGLDGKTAYSTNNGQKWVYSDVTKMFSEDSEVKSFYGIAFGKDRFIATGHEGVIMYMLDTK